MSQSIVSYVAVEHPLFLQPCRYCTTTLALTNPFRTGAYLIRD